MAVKLKPYQELPVEFMKNNYGLILFHSTGSGKTLTSLVSLYNFNKKIIIIGPKSSRKAFNDEISRLNYDITRFEMFSYNKIKKMIYDDINIFVDKCIIVDEAHHLRSETRDNIMLASVLQLSYKVMLLTATPIVNYPNDIANLVNIAKKGDILPIDKDLFNFLYFDEDKLELLNENLLKTKLSGCISYYEKKDNGDYPTTEMIYKKIIMNKQQIDAYGQYVKRFIYNYQVPASTNLYDIHFENLKKSQKNSFFAASRQISNTVNGSVESPKIIEIFKVITEAIKNKETPIVVYSNFLENGIYPIAKLCNNNDINYNMITGNTSPEKLQKIVNDYNDSKITVLLISTASSESVHLLKTAVLIIMEEHYNFQKIKQVIGRTVRYKSHTDLPKNKQHVKIYRFYSVFPADYNNMSADQYLIELSKRKEEILESFKDIVITSAIENDPKYKKGGYYSKYIKYKAKYLKFKNNNIK